MLVIFDCSPAYFLVKGTRYREERYSTQQQAANLIRRVPPGFKAYAATADHNDEDNQMLDSLYKRLDRATVVRTMPPGCAYVAKACSRTG
jgi:hypothetical protein